MNTDSGPEDAIQVSLLTGWLGSGKTTLLNIMSGLDNPTEGDVLLKGRNMAKLTGNELSDFRFGSSVG